MEAEDVRGSWLRPLFFVRHRHAGQWRDVDDAGRLLFAFKSKLFPPGQEGLVDRMWREMRLPVTIRSDWTSRFYETIEKFAAAVQ